MDWKHLLAYITGTVDQELLLRNEYLVTENRMLRNQVTGRLRLTDGERKVAYLLAADNGSGPLPFRLRCVNQPVISTPNVFSSTRSPLLGCIRAHFSCSTPRSSTSARF